MRLPNDTVIQLFTHLNYRDRANLSSTCKSWRSLGSSSCLWESLDLRPHKCDWGVMASLAPRCVNLQKLRFRGGDNTDSLINLRAKNLKELSGDCCRKITDSTLAVIVACHKLLETIQLGPDFCERISSEAIVAIAFCCTKLRKLQLSGIRDVKAEAINALASHCPELSEVGFIDSLKIDEVAISNVVSLRFLSITGTTNVKWNLVGEHWSKLPNLKGLDVSRTDVVPNVVVRLFSSLQSLKILCAFHCPSLEEDTSAFNTNNCHGKMLLSFFNDTFKEISSLFPEREKVRESEQEVVSPLFTETENEVELERERERVRERERQREREVFSYWRNKSEKKDGNLDEIMTWLEWIISHSLLRIAESNPNGLDHFGSVKVHIFCSILCRVLKRMFKNGLQWGLELLWW